MTTKTKTTVIILTTLLIGIVIGAFGSGMLRQWKREKMDRMPPDRRFSEVMEKIIKPDDKQREEIHKILNEQAERIAGIQERNHNQIMSVFLDSRMAMDSILTQAQRQRLRESIKKGEERFIEMRVRRLSEMLKLNADQKKRIAEIYRINGGGPGGPYFGVNSDSMETLAKIKEKMNKVDEEIKAVLTPAQREKFERFREHRGRPFEGMFPPQPPGKRPLRNGDFHQNRGFSP